MEQQEELYDLLIVADATSSMSDYLTSLQTSLPQIISISALTGCFSRIGLLCYRDYGDEDLLEWSGWLDQSSGEEQPDLLAKSKSIAPKGGGDYPEATKTGLAKAYEVMRKEATTIILLYTDAPPHAAVNALPFGTDSNHVQEKRALSKPESYGGFGPSFVDWVSACRTLRSGQKKAQVFCILEPSMAWQYVGHYNYICTMTGGSCIYLKNSEPASISKVTVEILLAWMGVEKAGTTATADKAELPADLSRYVNIGNIKKIKDEDDKAANSFFSTTSSGENKSKSAISANVTSVRMTSEMLKKYLPRKKTPVSDFAKSWKTDAAYRVIAIEHLRKIIDTDVRTISVNPVFGSLWRAVCNDRTLEARESLIAAFGLQIERISKADEKAQMKAWLEESYDYTAEVRDIINSVPEAERFPCVCLDPTLNFVFPGANPDEEDEDYRPITAFRRDELLEIGRSCDTKILRRLGRILTRLTYIESAAEMPEHIAATSGDEVPKIPMALASKEHGRQFWRILLHIVIPGTMLSARPAALLAALSLRIAVAPLTQAAENQMLLWRSRWNDIDVPENWSVSCLSLLLDADQMYRQRREEFHSSNEGDKKDVGLLKANDRALFEQLIAFKMLGLNLESTLTAQIGWTPEKTTVPIGPVAVCRSCHFPRSVSIMGRSGKCGHCLYADYASPEIREKCIKSRVSKEDGEPTPATWVECSVRTCRAQYVVYNVEALNVRPKCYYCRSQNALPAAQRNGDPAPWLECTQCLNRVIWPEAYRPSSISKSSYRCPACMAGHKTIAEIEATAKQISAESTMSWLIRDSESADQDPFTNRSLYHTISSIGVNKFLSRIRLFPDTKTPLTLNGKLIQNPSSLVSTLQDLISRRQIERAPCSLCFSTFHPTTLNAACGRRGCLQRICRGCLSNWYGVNRPGHIINTAALSCPFCRRKPAARTLSKYSMGIHAVSNLAMAVEERGHWIYAWCHDCGSAKQYMERVCARGVPPDIEGWTCDNCRDEAQMLRLLIEQENVERTIQDARIARDFATLEEAEMVRDALRKSGLATFRSTKKCPGCGVLTEKAGGCNHVTCVMQDCGVHWCFACGEGFSEFMIYNHMKREHGSFYGEDEDWDGDNSE